MKRFFAIILAAILVLCCGISFAEQSVTLENVSSIYMNEYNNTYALHIEGENTYTLVDALGKPISDTQYLYLIPSYRYFVARIDDKENGLGLIDATGKIVVPMEYVDFSFISDRWIAAYKGTPVEEGMDYDTSDNSLSETVYYVIDTVDFYLNGVKAKTLSQSEYVYATAYGNYLEIIDENDEYHHYDKNGNESPCTEYGEYFHYYPEDGSDAVYIHTGTNQQAFTAGCTLTAEDVQEPFMEINGFIVDLQGNQLFANEWGSIRYLVDGGVFAGGYRHGIGLIDKDGNLLLPMEYDSVGVMGYDLGNVMDYGYVPVVKNGKYGFASLRGKDTSGTFVDAEKIGYCGLSYAFRDEEGKIWVISAVSGLLEIPFVYLDYNYPCVTFVGQTEDGKIAVYGLNGEVLLTNDSWKYMNDIEISSDGTTVCVRDAYGVYTLYALDYQPE